MVIKIKESLNLRAIRYILFLLLQRGNKQIEIWNLGSSFTIEIEYETFDEQMDITRDEPEIEDFTVKKEMENI